MYVKIHVTQEAAVTAICDEDLIGKTISDKDKELDITERFYKGEVKSDEEVIEIMEKATNLNLVGEKTIKLALENNIIEESAVIKIGEVPHAQRFEV